MEETSKDLYSNISKTYSLSRPSHPKELFDYILKFVPGFTLAWDAATGNGQAAVELSEHFERVIATDIGPGQIAQAIPKPNVEYYVEKCEDIESDLIPPNSVDLITVAVAIHWFPLNSFYKRVRKVLKPGGIIAAWVYWYPKVTPEFDSIYQQIEKDYLEKYALPQVEYARQGYKNLPWPFKKPDGYKCDENGINQRFKYTKKANLKQFCEYLKTSSAAQQYFENEGKDAIDLNYPSLLKGWGGDPEIIRELTWNISLVLGKHE